MSARAECKTVREVWLMSVGHARGERNAIMRMARHEPRPVIRSALVKSARSWNTEVVANVRRARDAS